MDLIVPVFCFFLHIPYCIHLLYFSSEITKGKSVEILKSQKGDLILFKGHDLNPTKPELVGMIIFK
jgi:hypothetical protein